MSEIIIDGEKYVREVDSQQIVVGESIKITESLIGKYCIVRTRYEGVVAGTVLQADETGVLLKDSKRLYYHKPKNKMSWYEGVSISGLDKSSKVSESVPLRAIVQDYSITECSEEARKSIEEFKANESK